MDDQFHAWQAKMERKQEQYERGMQSLLQHAKQLNQENKELRAQISSGHCVSRMSHHKPSRMTSKPTRSRLRAYKHLTKPLKEEE